MTGSPALPPNMPRSASGTDPQHLLITLIGDYWWGNAQPIPSRALVDLLAEFGTTESSARQALHRLTTRGMLVPSKLGRATFYARPQGTADAIRTRLRRAMGFAQSYPDWDGRWTVVVFSVPEKQRDVRRHLRSGLRDLGFGLLQEAVWVTPHDRTAESAELLDELHVEVATVMRADIFPRTDVPHVETSALFELDDLAESYRQFIADFAGEVDVARSGRITPADALLLRTRAMGRWLGFRRDDPELPRELLPADWPRDDARDVFFAIYDALGAPAERRFAEILARHAPELATQTSHHVSQDGLR